ncbi:MAG: lipopolysaccharide biosynthesis protein [Candidatus Omnitrophota bacterium]|mgnify:CR=1 FL=1
MPIKENEKTLSSNVAHGAFWVIISYSFSNILYFLRTFILIRLLSPIDFGLMGVANVVIDMFNRFTETGIGMALVQKKEINKATLDTAWIITFVRGAVLFVLLYLFSPLVANFYNSTQLNNILKFISLCFLFNGIASIGVSLFVKELNFKDKAIFEQTSAVTNTIVSIALAIIFKNVWALVIGHIIGTIVGSVFSYILYPFRPSLNFSLNEARGLFCFGKYVFASVVVTFFVVRGPDALVGKVLGLGSLGFYVAAFGIANIPATSVTHLISQITLPAYAKLRDDLPTLRDGYLKVTRLIAFLSTPIAGGIFMLIPEFVQIFLGTKWMPIVVPVRILCIFGFFRSIYTAMSPVLYAVGRPDLEFKITSLNLVATAILIYPFTRAMGIAGTSMVFSLVGTMCMFVAGSLIYRLVRLNEAGAQFFKDIIFPLVGTLFMCLFIFLIKPWFSYRSAMSFMALILMGGGLYILPLYFFDKYFNYGLVDTIRFAVVSFKKR